MLDQPTPEDLATARARLEPFARWEVVKHILRQLPPPPSPRAWGDACARLEVCPSPRIMVAVAAEIRKEWEG